MHKKHFFPAVSRQRCRPAEAQRHRNTWAGWKVKGWVASFLCLLFLVVMSPVTYAAARVEAQHNVFSYGQCTWWANERYHQLHGFYVPWQTNADARQWPDRAHDAQWDVVFDHPEQGDILTLQPFTQGAFGLGHVAIVEHVLRDGSVIASSMNWNDIHDQSTRTHFTSGPGVSFLRDPSLSTTSNT